MKKRIGNWTNLIGVVALAMVLAMGLPMLAMAEEPIPPGGITEGEVITNPGFIKGTISLGDTSRNMYPATQVTLTATGTDSGGKDLSSTVVLKGAENMSNYEMTVQIPTDVMNAGGTQRYVVHCYILYGSSNRYFHFKTQTVDVPYGNQNAPKIVDFVVKPGFITGPLPTNCQIKSGWIIAELTGEVSTRIDFVNPDPTKPATFYFPVQPNKDIKVRGEYTRTDGWTYPLEEKLVTVAEGQEVYPGWILAQCGGTDPCSGTLKGQFGLEGLGANVLSKQTIALSGSTVASATFTTSGPYIFENLKPGIHYVSAAISLNPLDNSGKNFDDTFIPPYADSAAKAIGLRRVDVQCDPVVIKDLTPKAAFVNGKLSFKKDATVAAFKNDQNPEVPMVTPTSAAIDGSGLFGTKGEGSYRNGYSSDRVDVNSGNYDLILSEGEWNVYHTDIRFSHKWVELCRDGKLRYVDSRMIVSELGRPNKLIQLSAGQVVNDNNFLFESGAATIRFYINGEGTMGNTGLSASSDPNDPLFKDMSVGLEASGISADGKTGEATLIGPPGTYNLTARAWVNGSLTTFGDLKITLVAGACQSFEIGAPTLTLNVTNTCNNEVTISGKATDKKSPIQSVRVNGQNIGFTATGNADNEVTFNITLPLQAGENKIETEVTNNAGKTASDSRTINSYSAGTFVVDNEGLVKIDWLYDGGRYQGQFGIFSLDGMGQFTPGSPEFIAEATNRVLSNTEKGYLVFSDLEEGARFSGILGNEIKDWNSGDYKGVKSFAMKPGSCFATVLVPNSTFQSLSQDPATTDTNKRPLFSLVSSNPAYGMYAGQMADINGMGKAYSYEDKDAAISDKDYNDLIMMITGATAELPSIDSLKSQRRDKRGYGDWRDSAFGQTILAHVEASANTSDSMTVTLNAPATLLIYDEAGKMIGKDGGYIAGAGFEMKADGTQTITLPNSGQYRVAIQGKAAGQGTLTVKTYQGGTEVSSGELAVDIAAHEILTTTISAGALPQTLNAAADYDFDADGAVDDADVQMLVKHWNSCRGQQKFDAFFDVNDDGCITVADIMMVLNAKTLK